MRGARSRAMALKIVKVVIALLFPMVVFVLFEGFQEQQSGRKAALDALPQTQPPAKPLNLRLYYGADAATEFWGALKSTHGLEAEQKYLTLDLTFPFVYGGALMISLAWLLSASGAPWPRGRVFLPVVAAMVGDWTENLIQLDQMSRFISTGRPGTIAMRLSSVATDVKLGGVLFAIVLAIRLAVFVVKHSGSRRRPIQVSSIQQ